MSALKPSRGSLNHALKILPPTLNWINNEFVKGNGEAYDAVCKATGKSVMTSTMANSQDVDFAISCAKKSFDSYRKLSPAERSDILLKAASLLESRISDFAHLECLDTGKPYYEAEIDTGTGIECLKLIGGIMQDYHGNHYSFGDSFGYTTHEPLGVIGAIGPWNYPLQTACWKIAPALACGNTVVYKPSEYTPLTTLALASLFKEVGLPSGVLNIVSGAGNVGSFISSHPSISKVSFTGSVPTGTKVMNACSRDLKKITLELGGKSPLIIFDDADLDDSVSVAMNANFFSQGAVCSNGTRVFVHKNIVDEFTRRFVDRSKKMKIGDPMAEDTKVGAIICKMQYDKILKYMDIAVNEGAEILCGGKGVIMSDPELQGGLYFPPTVLGRCTDDMVCVKEEIFGPVASILTFESEAEVISRANDSSFGLAAGVCTKDLSRAYRVISSLEAGHCNINSYNMFPPQLPFGGFKMSGIGRELGRECLNYYSQSKSVYVETGKPWCPFD